MFEEYHWNNYFFWFFGFLFDFWRTRFFWFPKFVRLISKVIFWFQNLSFWFLKWLFDFQNLSVWFLRWFFDFQNLSFWFLKWIFYFQNLSFASSYVPLFYSLYLSPCNSLLQYARSSKIVWRPVVMQVSQGNPRIMT